jgi:hypothetical protein
MHAIICDAIRAKRLIRFIYEGYERIVEPHLHGINTANHEMLSGWLVGGWSESRPQPGWRNYLVRDMHDVHALADGFEGPRPKYNANDPQLRQVFCRIEPVADAGRAAERSAPIADMRAPIADAVPGEAAPPAERAPGAVPGSGLEPPPPA